MNLRENIDNSSHVAFQETLELLEWPDLCHQLSTFVSTDEGRRQCENLFIPRDFQTSCRYLDTTLEIGALDELIEGGLSFQGIHDLRNILLKCSKGGSVSGEDLLKVAETLRSTRRLRRQIDNPEIRPVTTSLIDNLTTLPELEKMIEFGLESGGRIADRASEKLSNERQKLHNLRLQRRERLQHLLNKYSSILQDTVIGERYGRPVIALKLGTVDQIAGTVHDTSSSGNTIFLEPQLVIPLGNQISQVESTINEEELRLLALWSREVGRHFVSLENLCNVVLQLDLALGRARYGKWMDGVPPSLKEQQDSPLTIQKFRHPLLIWQEKHGQGAKVIPISFDVSSDLRVVAITGPNTGGKTVTLKSFGLAVLMARAGLLLPCIGTPCVPWFYQVLADIGDEQSLQQNLSTFSGHIMRISRILNAISTSPGPSLILLDEVGAGTDPLEGTSIAIALLKVLSERARLTVATTHFGELKALKYSDSRFENASVAFDAETMRPAYNLQWGIPGRSNAIAIARRLGFDPIIIQNAEKLIKNKGVHGTNQIIKGLEEEKQRQQNAAEDAAALLARTELLHDELLEQWQQQKQRSADFQEQARRKLEASIREGQDEVRKLIRRLRDKGAHGEIARTTGKRLRQIEIEFRPETKTRNVKLWMPKIGDQVRLIQIGKAGTVLGISEDGLQLNVLCGIFRSNVDIRDVESIDGLKPTISDAVVNLKTNSSVRHEALIRTKRNTLDVRGLRVHEAQAVIEERLRNTMGPIWVIHGIGTGKLKRGLRDWLQSLSYVQKVVDADQKDGGAGCSVIWLD